MYKFKRTDKFKRQYSDLPREIERKAEKAFRLLASDFRHPSLHTKRIKGKEHVWEARIDRRYRFKFQIDKENQIYLLREIGKHDIL